MNAKAKQNRARTGEQPWWRQRVYRNLVWVTLLVGGLTALAVLFLVDRDAGGSTGSDGSRFSAIYTFETDDLHALTFAPADSERLFFGHHGGVISSDDGGRSWNDVVDRTNFDGMNLVFDPDQPSTLYLAGHNVLSRSDDGGESWQSFTHDLPGLDLHAFAASARTPGRFYAFAVGKGLFASDGGASNWTQVWAGAPQGTNSIVELEEGELLLGAMDQGILRSEDGGKTWSESRTGIDTGTILTVKGDPQARVIYAGTSKGLYASSDRGRTWSQTSLNDTWVVTVGVDPSNPEHVMAIGRSGELYHSTDGGSTWGG